jgi:hypothetical protein
MLSSRESPRNSQAMVISELQQALGNRKQKLSIELEGESSTDVTLSSSLNPQSISTVDESTTAHKPRPSSVPTIMLPGDLELSRLQFVNRILKSL